MADIDALIKRGLISDRAAQRLRESMQKSFGDAAEHQQRWGMPPASEQIPGIISRTAQVPVDAAMMGPRLMGDVAAGRVDPLSSEGIGRSTDVALSLLGGGAMGAERGAIGAMGGKMTVRPASEDVHAVAAANFEHGLPVGNRTFPIDNLKGGIVNSPAEISRVDRLAEQINGPDGYISRPIVDDVGNIIEGQHRVAALQKLGIKEVPVTVIKDLARDYDLDAIKNAVKNVGPLHPDQVHDIVGQVLQLTHKENGNPVAVWNGYEFPAMRRQFFEALKEIGRQQEAKTATAQ